jgi:hypothetical protein
MKRFQPVWVVGLMPYIVVARVEFVSLPEKSQRQLSD